MSDAHELHPGFTPAPDLPLSERHKAESVLRIVREEELADTAAEAVQIPISQTESTDEISPAEALKQVGEGVALLGMWAVSKSFGLLNRIIPGRTEDA